MTTSSTPLLDNSNTLMVKLNNGAMSPTSITGALIQYICEDHPEWAPHRSVTNDEAVRALILHMQWDGLRPELMDERTGPVNMQRGEARGNFFLCSAGFYIANLVKEQIQAILTAWEAHKESAQYRNAVELVAIAGQIKREAALLERPRYGHDTREGMVSAKYRDRIKTLERESNAILRSRLTTTHHP